MKSLLSTSVHLIIYLQISKVFCGTLQQFLGASVNQLLNPVSRAVLHLPLTYCFQFMLTDKVCIISEYIFGHEFYIYNTVSP
jgi:hypothetical protein